MPKDHEFYTGGIFMGTGEFLRSIRREKHMTQQEVADYCGISQTSYQRYENTDRKPNVEIARKLSTLFGITIEEISLGCRSSDKPAAFEKRMPTDEELKFALFGDATVPPELFEQVKAYAHFILAFRWGKKK